MIHITIGEVSYEVPNPVNDWMDFANKVIITSKIVRELQTEYFSITGNKILKQATLRECKAWEKRLDDLIAGKSPEKEAAQAELFR